MSLAVFNNPGSMIYPTKDKNYCQFDEVRVMYYLSQKEKSLPYLEEVLNTSKDETKQVVALYITNRLLDDGVKGVDKMYPTLSKYNNSDSPYIQTYLAGIYRKIKVPDAFGPLMSMLIKNSINPPDKSCGFDPNEEVGGAILDYLA
ncbi:MAG: hypothetical protein NC200_03605 [Candidatus Gastranaerophilales bacterium]|nr:hypothetical protein [Candidatus Gastranaerophilales bacterium]